jgi:hypothetical protein
MLFGARKDLDHAAMADALEGGADIHALTRMTAIHSAPSLNCSHGTVRTSGARPVASRRASFPATAEKTQSAPYVPRSTRRFPFNPARASCRPPVSHPKD